jgi:Zn-finger nucleic acid-binding protein
MVTLKRQCPKDSTWMNQIRYEGQIIDQCTLCGGTWCDGGEFEAILESRERKFSDKEIKSAKYVDKIQVVELERRKILACVVCKAGLVKKDLKTGSKITIDVCPRGHGTWLDYGELERIQILVEESERKQASGKPDETTHYSELLKMAKTTIIPAKARGGGGKASSG